MRVDTWVNSVNMDSAPALQRPDKSSEPEDVNRAHHRIASANQHATHVDIKKNMYCGVCGPVWGS